MNSFLDILGIGWHIFVARVLGYVVVKTVVQTPVLAWLPYHRHPSLLLRVNRLVWVIMFHFVVVLMCQITVTEPGWIARYHHVLSRPWHCHQPRVHVLCWVHNVLLTIHARQASHVHRQFWVCLLFERFDYLVAISNYWRLPQPRVVVLLHAFLDWRELNCKSLAKSKRNLRWTPRRLNSWCGLSFDSLHWPSF